jgi:carboxymethylenebutenolidase
MAAEGYVALAPALFDRMTPGFECGYTPDEIANARQYIANPDWSAMLRDTDAAIKELNGVGPLAIMGFCMGGTISFLAATRLSGLKAAVCYYGGGIANFADEKPKCPTQMHFGRKDAHITMDKVDLIKSKRPDCEIYVYDEADHGFHCDERGSYHAESAKIAWGRSMTFLEKNMK